MSTAHPVHASVAFVRVPDFAHLPAASQATRKEQMEARVRSVLAHVAAENRLVLEADDGFAVVLFEDLARALDIALQLHAGAGGQAGLGYGPLALGAAGADARVFGDGLASAASASKFASRDRMLVTDGFARALRAASPDRAEDLAPAGEFTDTNVRVHSFFAPDAQRRAMLRRRLAVMAVGGSILILLAGVVGRDIYQPLFRTRPAVVLLEVKPRGEVFVDGNSMGKIPPLARLELAPGRHRLAIRNPGSRPYEVSLDLAAGQRITIAHTFVAAPAPKADIWRDLRKRFGS
jgi:hypothetical protein